MIEMRLLRNALMLENHQNFARAAKALNLSQPTLSRSIQLLESIVGERLFDRESRKVVPTQAGEIILKHARVILSSVSSMEEAIGQHQGILEGTLSIGAGPYAACALVSQAIGHFSAQHPGIKTEISVDNWSLLPERLIQKDFDYVVMDSSKLGTNKDFDITQLNAHPVFFFCRHDHPLIKNNQQQKLRITDLAPFPLILTTLPDRVSQILKKIFSANDSVTVSNLQENITSNDMATIKATVLQSNFLGLGTYGTLAPELEVGLFVPLPFRIPELHTFYNIVKRKGLSLSPAALALIKILVDLDEQQSVIEKKLVQSLGLPI